MNADVAADRGVTLRLGIQGYFGHQRGDFHRFRTIHPDKFNAAVRRRRFDFKVDVVAGVKP
jgi:hypothetical protein